MPAFLRSFLCYIGFHSWSYLCTLEGEAGEYSCYECKHCKKYEEVSEFNDDLW